VAGTLGITVPRTTVTNSPKRFLEFYEECQSPIISKGCTEPLLLTHKGEKRMTYTYPVQRRNVAAYQSIRYSAVVFQEEIPKKLELRITVVGAKVFPAAIMSQESRALRHDWRHYPSFAGARFYSEYKLPAKIEDFCVRMVEALGLCFGAIDMILTPEGEYVFLEVNPNGQWGWIEQYTGLPIGDAIVEMLLSRAA
jgi:glutathione synthase/RimK-type ligase-like ATP-grasp enzyme